ncbi:MAG: glutathione S-transferase family protein [Pseudomonadota bacterium]
MILIGRNLSPYARRVAIWMALQGRSFSRQELAATDPKDAEAIRAYHPGTRVPALVLDDGSVLIDSFAICDFLDDTMPERRLVPASGEARRACLQRMALAHATTEKIVSLVYEKNRRPSELHWSAWQDRVIGQIKGGLDAMEAAAADGFNGGEEPDGSDVAIVCAVDMIEATNPLVADAPLSKLRALQRRAHGIEAFSATKP